jgi:hypothetical protein
VVVQLDPAGRVVSPLRDPVVLAGAVVWALSGVLALVVAVRGTWIAVAARRAERREAVRVTAPRSLARSFEVDLEVDPEWGWPDRP